MLETFELSTFELRVFELRAQMPVMRCVMAPRYYWEHGAILIRNFVESGPQNGDFY